MDDQGPECLSSANDILADMESSGDAFHENKDFINALTYLGRPPGHDLLDIDMAPRVSTPSPSVGTFKRLIGPGLPLRRSGADVLALLQNMLAPSRSFGRRPGR